jgi:hypothetical protein
MFTNIEQTGFTDVVANPQALEHPEDLELGPAMRLAQYCTLEECIGVVFGLMSLWYVVCSIIRLA